MMPQPNHNSSNRRNSTGSSSGHILYEVKPNLLTYPDNFISKIIVVFLLAFLFVPILSVIAEVQLILMNTLGIDIPQLTSFCELILILVILFVIIKIVLDVVDRNYTTYTLTSRYIIIDRGIFRHEKLTMSYDKIQDLEVQQSFIERLLNVGDIIIYGGHDNSKIILDDTPNPKYVEELIEQQQEQYNIGDYQPQYEMQHQRYNPAYESQYYEHNFNQHQQYNQDRQPRNDNDYYYEDKQYDKGHDSGYFDDDFNNNSLKKRYDNHRKSKKNKKQYKNDIINKHQQMFKKYNNDDD